MDCVKCGHENPEKALICYWCGSDPNTGAAPNWEMTASFVGPEGGLTLPEVTLPPPVEVPAPMPVPDIQVSMAAVESLGLRMPDLPTIEIPLPLEIPDQAQFVTVRRRARHRPVVYASSGRPMVTRPVLPGWGRILVFVGGLGLLFVLGALLVAAVGAASFGSGFLLLGLLGAAVVLWAGLLLVRAGRRIVSRTGAAFERLEVMGRILREVAPGVIQELPMNLPAKMGVLDLPVAFSELRALAGNDGEAPMELAVDLLTGAIADLVGRDDVILARRSYPVETRGMLTRPSSTEVSRPILTRRRIHVGPGQLEGKIAQTLHTDQPMTVEEVVRELAGPAGRQRAQRVINWVNQALSENPPDLEAVASADDALAELQRFREAMRGSDPELYQLLEDEIRRALGAVAQRSIPTSFLDLARYASTTGERSSQAQRKSGPTRRG